jgi:hypothetical protein
VPSLTNNQQASVVAAIKELATAANTKSNAFWEAFNNTKNDDTAFGHLLTAIDAIMNSVDQRSACDAAIQAATAPVLPAGAGITEGQNALLHKIINLNNIQEIQTAITNGTATTALTALIGTLQDGNAIKQMLQNVLVSVNALQPILAAAAPAPAAAPAAAAAPAVAPAAAPAAAAAAAAAILTQFGDLHRLREADNTTWKQSYAARTVENVPDIVLKQLVKNVSTLNANNDINEVTDKAMYIAAQLQQLSTQDTISKANLVSMVKHITQSVIGEFPEKLHNIIAAELAGYQDDANYFTTVKTGYANNDTLTAAEKKRLDKTFDAISSLLNSQAASLEALMADPTKGARDKASEIFCCVNDLCNCFVELQSYCNINEDVKLDDLSFTASANHKQLAAEYLNNQAHISHIVNNHIRSYDAALRPEGIPQRLGQATALSTALLEVHKDVKNIFTKQKNELKDFINKFNTHNHQTDVKENNIDTIKYEKDLIKTEWNKIIGSQTDAAAINKFISDTQNNVNLFRAKHPNDQGANILPATTDAIYNTLVQLQYNIEQQVQPPAAPAVEQKAPAPPPATTLAVPPPKGRYNINIPQPTQLQTDTFNLDFFQPRGDPYSPARRSGGNNSVGTVQLVNDDKSWQKPDASKMQHCLLMRHNQEPKKTEGILQANMAVVNRAISALFNNNKALSSEQISNYKLQLKTLQTTLIEAIKECGIDPPDFYNIMNGKLGTLAEIYEVSQLAATSHKAKLDEPRGAVVSNVLHAVLLYNQMLRLDHFEKYSAIVNNGSPIDITEIETSMKNDYAQFMFDANWYIAQYPSIMSKEDVQKCLNEVHHPAYKPLYSTKIHVEALHTAEAILNAIDTNDIIHSNVILDKNIKNILNQRDITAEPIKIIKQIQSAIKSSKADNVGKELNKLYKTLANQAAITQVLAEKMNADCKTEYEAMKKSIDAIGTYGDIIYLQMQEHEKQKNTSPDHMSRLEQQMELYLAKITEEVGTFKGHWKTASSNIISEVNNAMQQDTDEDKKIGLVFMVIGTILNLISVALFGVAIYHLVEADKIQAKYDKEVNDYKAPNFQKVPIINYQDGNQLYYLTDDGKYVPLSTLSPEEYNKALLSLSDNNPSNDRIFGSNDGVKYYAWSDIKRQPGFTQATQIISADIPDAVKTIPTPPVLNSDEIKRLDNIGYGVLGGSLVAGVVGIGATAYGYNKYNNAVNTQEEHEEKQKNNAIKAGKQSPKTSLTSNRAPHTKTGYHGNHTMPVAQINNNSLYYVDSSQQQNNQWTAATKVAVQQNNVSALSTEQKVYIVHNYCIDKIEQELKNVTDEATKQNVILKYAYILSDCVDKIGHNIELNNIKGYIDRIAPNAPNYQKGADAASRIANDICFLYRIDYPIINTKYQDIVNECVGKTDSATDDIEATADKCIQTCFTSLETLINNEQKPPLLPSLPKQNGPTAPKVSLAY